MSLFSKTGAGVTSVTENEDFTLVTENDMVDLMTVAIMENCSADEIDEMVEEAARGEYVGEPVLEKTIVKLDKNAKKKQAYKLGLLQVASEENSKDYKKLRKLWQLEAVLMKKLEKRLKSKAEKRGRELFKTMSKSKKPQVAKTGARMLKTSTSKVSK